MNNIYHFNNIRDHDFLVISLILIIKPIIPITKIRMQKLICNTKILSTKKVWTFFYELRFLFTDYNETIMYIK